MNLNPNRFGFVRNSVSFLSIFAFAVAFSSFIAIEFLYNPNPKNDASILEKRTAYIKEIEALPVEPGQGSAYFTINSTENVLLNKESTLSLMLINAENKPINAFVLALFIPDTLELVSKPDVTLLSKSVVNFVEYIPVAGGIEVHIFAGAKPDSILTSDVNTNVLNLNFIPKSDGTHTVKFLKLVPSYPEILDTSSQSLLDITELNDLVLTISKTVATEPTISPDSGEFSNAVKVIINNSLSNSSVKYTTDNSDPRTSTTAVTITSFPHELLLSDNSLKVFRAYTFGDLYNPSNVVTKTYTYIVAPITAGSNSATEISNPFRETLTTMTTGAKIYYTLDGSDPLNSSSAILYDGVGINLNHTVTLKAIAVKNGYVNSNLFTKNYTFSAPEVIYTGLGYCISKVECEFGINDIKDTALTLRYDPKSPNNVPSKIDFIIQDNLGNVKLALNNVTPVTNIFTVNIPNYKNYFDLNNPNYIEIKSYSATGVYTSLIYIPKLNTLPVIDSYSPTALDTYSKASFKVSASDGGGVIENSDVTSVELLRKDSTLSDFTSIKKVNTQPGSQNIIDFVIEDTTLNKPGNYTYAIKVYDNLGLTRYSEDIPVRFFEKGDVNKDFKLDIPNDLFAIIKAIFGSLTPNTESMDINLDTKVDPLDIIKLLKKLFI